MSQRAVIEGKLHPGNVDADLVRFEAHLIERGLSRHYICQRRPHAVQFLDYITHRGMALATVQADQVERYFRVALRIYKKRHPNRLKSLGYWRTTSKRSVYALLQFVQGEWPPGLAPILAHFRSELERLRYNRAGIPTRISAARQFLLFLREHRISLEETRPSHIDAFLQTKLERFRKRHGCLPRDSVTWRSIYTGPIHRLLRMMQPQWPPPNLRPMIASDSSARCVTVTANGLLKSRVYPGGLSLRMVMRQSCFFVGWENELIVSRLPA